MRYRALTRSASVDGGSRMWLITVAWPFRVTVTGLTGVCDDAHSLHKRQALTLGSRRKASCDGIRPRSAPRAVGSVG